MTKSNQVINPLFTSSIYYPINFHGTIKSDVSYAADPALLMDIYYPIAVNKPAPVVVLVTGYPDEGFEQVAGLKLKDIQQYISWAQLLSVSGITAITYSNTDPEQDIFTLLTYLKENAAELNIDSDNIALWSCSGNVPNAISVLASGTSIKCAAFLYGFMIDLQGEKTVAEAAEMFRFVNPMQAVDVFPQLAPTLVIRPGKDDMQGLNQSIDRFIGEAIKHNSPISLLNLSQANHAFDVIDKSFATQETISQIIAFYQQHLFQPVS